MKLKPNLRLLILAFSISANILLAQEPTNATGQPPYSSDSVRSFFSDHYELYNDTKFTASVWGQSTITKFDTLFDNDVMMTLTSFNWVPLSIDPKMNIDDMDYIHMDIYVFKEGCSMRFGFRTWSPDIESWFPDAFPLKANQWTSINLPVSVLKKTGINCSGINLMRLNGTGNGAPVYIDNIYAFQGEPKDNSDLPTFEISSPPSPILNASIVKAICADDYENITKLVEQDWGQATKYTYIKNTAQDYVIKLNSLDYMVFETSPELDLSDMDNLHLSIYNMDEQASTLEFGFQTLEPEIEKYSSVKAELKPQQWTYVILPLQEFANAGMDLSALNFIRLKGSGNLYLDNIFAFKGSYVEAQGEGIPISMDWDAASADDELPDINDAFLGVNLATGSGGSNPGIYGTNYSYPTFKDLYYFKHKGVRLVRIPFRWERIQHELGGPLDLEEDVAAIKEVVKEAERIGMYVMLDMHNYARRSVDSSSYVIGSSDVVTFEHFADVWTKLANEFKDFTNIWAYDLMNEPHNLGSVKLNDIFQAAIDGIRSVDDHTAISVEGNSFAASSSWPYSGGGLIDLVDPSNNLIFHAHTYFDNNNSGTYQNNYDREVTNPLIYYNRLKPFVDWLKENNKRGVLGEFGVPASDSRWLDILDATLAYLQANGVSATYWCAGSWYDNYFLSAQPTSNYTYEKPQMAVLDKYIADFNSGGTGVKSIKKQSIKIYPNPAKDYVMLTNEEIITSVSIYNTTGQLVKNIQTNNNYVEIELNALTKGTYIISVRLENGKTCINKLIKN